MTLAELKSRRIAIESMTDIDATAKTDSLKYIDRAIAYAELAFSTNKKANELSQAHPDSPRAVENIAGRAEKVVHGA